MQLSRESITEAAMQLLAQYGLADVSMRRIASSLGVAPGALYWHVKNKQELIAALALRIVSPVLQDDSTQEASSLARRLAETLVAVRDGAEVVTAAVGQPGSEVGRALAQRLRTALEAEFEDKSTLLIDAAVNGLLTLTLGAATVYQSGAQIAAATGSPAADRSTVALQHAMAVQFLLDGLRHAR